MKPCTFCARHIRSDERACPFCSASFTNACRDVAAFGLALALASGLACTDGKDTSAGESTSYSTTVDPTASTSLVTNPSDGDNAAVSYYAGPSDSWDTEGWTTTTFTTTETTEVTTADDTTDATTDGDTTDGTTTDGTTTDGDTDDTTDTD
ncbi:MAG: hypothetical protein IPK80_04425 [Nannocystis sp.]|nr:hypothetical protein [Nannocystis sp.]